MDLNYVKISEEKLSNIKPNYRLGDIWVSFYLNKVVEMENQNMIIFNE